MPKSAPCPLLKRKITACAAAYLCKDRAEKELPLRAALGCGETELVWCTLLLIQKSHSGLTATFTLAAEYSGTSQSRQACQCSADKSSASNRRLIE